MPDAAGNAPALEDINLHDIDRICISLEMATPEAT